MRSINDWLAIYCWKYIFLGSIVLTASMSGGYTDHEERLLFKQWMEEEAKKQKKGVDKCI